MVNPKARKQQMGDQSQQGGSLFATCTKAGKFIMAVVGIEWFKSAKKGTPGYNVRSVILDGPQAGETVETDVWLTGEMKSLCDLVLAHGYEEPLDENDIELILEIIQKVPCFAGVVENEPYNGRNKFKVRYFNKARSTVEEPNWNDVKNTAYDDWDKYLKWRANNPRSSAPESNNTPQSQASDSSGSDADIPF